MVERRLASRSLSGAPVHRRPLPYHEGQYPLKFMIVPTVQPQGRAASSSPTLTHVDGLVIVIVDC